MKNYLLNEHNLFFHFRTRVKVLSLKPFIFTVLKKYFFR